MNTRFSVIAKSREVPLCKQYCLLLKRFMIYTVRSPISIVFLIFLAFFQAFLQASIYHGIGEMQFSRTDPAADY